MSEKIQPDKLLSLALHLALLYMCLRSCDMDLNKTERGMQLLEIGAKRRTHRRAETEMDTEIEREETGYIKEKS